jgi:hypothetical protein
MATTFSLEELDADTRHYLIEVRDREGRGSPGVFAPVKNPWPAVGCIVGPIIIGVTLLATLLSDIILDDPGGVALLQTAGILLGGWMFVYAFRVWMSKGSKRVAGHWVYADPLFLYQAKGDKIGITPVTEVIEAQYTHNYNNGAYQNSVVRLLLPGNHIASATLHHEQRAENIVVYYNYLAWARGPDGGDRAHLPPATLGGLAKYVAKNDNEPLDAEGNVDLSRVELDIDEVPEDPRREGRAMPNVIPYIVIVLAGIVCWLVMQEVNTPRRDDEIYAAVTREPVEPRFLRAYLIDEKRNTRHREQVKDRLETFYTRKVINEIAKGNGDATLRAGMAQLVESLKRADQPVVSIRVREEKSPAGQDSGAADRAKKVQTGFADKVLEVFKGWEPPVQAPPGTVFKESPPPIGEQLIAFVEAPEEAKAAHIEVTYEFISDGGGRYTLQWTATIRVDVNDDPVATRTLKETRGYTADQADAAAGDLRDSLARALVGTGTGPAAPPGGPGFPKLP